MKRVLVFALALIIALGTGAFLTATALETPQLPTLGLTTVKGADFATTEGFTDFDMTGYDPDFLIGAVLTMEDIGNGYEDYIVDCILNLSVPCKAKLLGKYSGKFGDFAWQGTTEFTDVPVGDYAVMQEALICMTVAEVADEVGTFYCAFEVDPNSIESSVSVTLEVKIFEEPTGDDTPVYIDPQYALGDVALSEEFTKVLPTASIVTVDGADFATTEGFTDFDMTGFDADFLVGAVLTIESTGKGYDDYLVECLLNLSIPCKAKLLGKYSGRFGNFPWQGTTTFTDVPAGDYAVMQEALIGMTVAEVADEVGTFYCAFAVDSATLMSDIGVSLDVKIFEEPTGSEAPSYIDPQYATGTDALYVEFQKVLPTAKVTMVSGTDFATTPGFTDFPMGTYDPEYVVGATFELIDAGKGCDDYIAEFLLRISDDCDAALLGQYGTYSWQGTNGESSFASITAGKYGIMSEALLDVRVGELESNIGTFYCAFVVDGLSFDASLDVRLELVVFEEPVGEASPNYITCPLTADSDNISINFTNELPAATLTAISGVNFAADAEYSQLDSMLYAAEDAFGITVNADNLGQGYDAYYSALNVTANNDVTGTVYIDSGNGFVSLGSMSFTGGVAKRLFPLTGTVDDAVTYRVVFVLDRTTLTADTGLTFRSGICASATDEAEFINTSSSVLKGFRKNEVVKIAVPVIPEATPEITPEDLVPVAPEGTVNVIVKDESGTVIESTAQIGTGMIIAFEDDKGDTIETVAVIMGDTDGTAGISDADFDAVLNMSLQPDNDSTGDIVPVHRIASDVNSDGFVDALDAMAVGLYLAGDAQYSEIVK